MSIAVSEIKQNDFPYMLKSWRKQRRVSQLDFSLDAGISQKHLSFLESGRSKPSRDMVLTISEALDLPLRERNQLLHSAGFAQVYKQRALDNADMKMVHDALHMSLKHHEPYPAVVIDRNWNLVMANAATYKMIGVLGDPEQRWQRVDPSGNKNIYRMTFSEHGVRPLIANWSELGPHLLSRLQREVDSDPGNQELASLYEEVVGMSGLDEQEFSAQNFDSLAPVLPMQMKVGTASLNVFSMISSFGTAQDVTAEEIKVEMFFPADDFTKAFFTAM